MSTICLEPSPVGMLFVFKDYNLEDEDELYEIHCNDRHIDGGDVRVDVSEYIRFGTHPVQRNRDVYGALYGRRNGRHNAALPVGHVQKTGVQLCHNGIERRYLYRIALPAAITGVPPSGGPF